MARVTLSTLENIENQTSFLESLNLNFDVLGDALDGLLSRLDSPEANEMHVNLDMNSFQILNLPAPISGSSPARWADVTSAITVDMVIPSLVGNAGNVLSNDGTNLLWSAPAGGALIASNNLNDLTSITTARTNLGLNSAATFSVGTSGNTVPLLNTANTWSLGQTWQGFATFNAGGSFNGTADFRILHNPTTLSADSVGFRGAPQNIQDTAYTFVLQDMGKGVSHSSATPHAWTIPPDADVAFPTHTVILLDNFGSGAVTLTRGIGVTLRENGSGTSTDIVIPQFYVRPLFKQGPNFWVLL
jgi:hypothetical protein